MERIFDKKYNAIGYLSNDAENGIWYGNDQLETSIDSGLYTFRFTVPKTTPRVNLLALGNYIETFTHNGKHLLLRIMSIEPENRNELVVMCEDSTIQATNSFVDAITAPIEPESIDYYAIQALERTDIQIKSIETNTPLKLEFSSDQRVLERLRLIAKEFEMELDFSIEFSPGERPVRYVSFKEKRVEDYAGFDVSSDDLLGGIERSQNLFNLATMLKVKGKSFGSETDVTTSTGQAPNTQPATTNYDSSKSSGATAISTTGWSESEVNNFKMNQADPPYVNGDYIDKFLRTYYSDSPLIGQGAVIKEMADYFGVSVGAAMGVWAKESTFGRGHPGQVDHNYGCIRHTSDWPAVYYGGSAWNKYPNKRTGIAAWFKLVRYVYIEKNRNRYEDFLNVYSPTSENTQSTFKNIMWGTLKSFGYNMSDSATKKNYSSASDDPRSVTTTSLSTPTDTVEDTSKDAIAEAVIAEAFRIKALGLTYQWGGNGNPSYDCSGFVQQCYKVAGLNPSSAGWPRATTYSMWASDGKFRRTTRDNLKRGDLIMYDTGYTTPGDVNHVGIYLGPSLDAPNSVIHAGNPVGLVQRANSMTIIGYVRVER